MKPLLLVLALVCAMLTGCMEQDMEQPNSVNDPFALKGETLAPPETAELEAALPQAFALPYDASRTLDPIACDSGMQQTVGALVYESLFYLDEAFAPQHLLCSGYTYDPATYTYTFSLRQDVLFSDGTPLTTADVRATLVRAKASVRYGARFAQVAAVAEGDGTVSVTLLGPNTQFIALLDIPIVKAGTEESLVPLGTGPYVVVTEESGAAALEKNPHWWQKKPLPLARLTLTDCPNQDLVQYRFTTHDVQLLAADLIGIDPLRASGNISFQPAHTTSLQYLGINMADPLLQKEEVRQALSLGLNREGLVSAHLSGHGAPAQFPLSPKSALYPQERDREYQSTQFAAALARAELDTGVPKTLRLIVNSENSFKVAVANQIAQNLSHGDLLVRVQPLPWEQYQAALVAGEFDLYYGEVQLTADWNLAPLLGTGGALNYGGYTSWEMDTAIQAYLQGADHLTNMDALCALFEETLPILPLCFKTTAVLSQTGVLENTHHTQANPFYQFSTWTVHLGA